MGRGIGLGLRPGGLVLTPAQRVVKKLFDDDVLHDILDPSSFPQTEIRASGALGWDGSVLANNVIARRTVPLFPGKRIHEVWCEPTFTRINDADMGNWTIGGAGAANLTVTDLGGNRYRISWVGGAGAGNVRVAVSVTNGVAHTASARMRILSGSIGGTGRSYYGVADSSLAAWWFFKDLYDEGLGAAWQWLHATGNTSATSGLVNLSFSTHDTVTLEVEFPQLVQREYPYRFMPGAGAGVTKQADDLTVDVSGLPGGGLGNVGGIWWRSKQKWTANPQVGTNARFFASLVANDYQEMITGPYSTANNEVSMFRSDSGSVKHARFIDGTIWADATKQYMAGMNWTAGGNLVSYYGAIQKTVTSGLPNPLALVTTIGVCRDGAGSIYTPGGVCGIASTRFLVLSEREALASVLGHGETANLGSI